MRALLIVLLASCLGCMRGQIVRDDTGRQFFIKDRVPVTLVVDFGPANRPSFREDIRVTKGSTPRDVVSIFFPIKSGAVCCDTREVNEIEGVSTDPVRSRFWVVDVNGSRNVSPFRTQVRRGDVVRWTYVGK